MSFEERRKKLREELSVLQQESYEYLMNDNERGIPQDLSDRIADKQWEIRDIGRWLRALGKE